MKVLSLFAGIGGFDLGLERAGMETVAFCEIDEFCQKVLLKNFPGKRIFTDIKSLTKEELNELGRIDVVCGGFPCQPFSIAGRKKGIEDNRDLWPEMFRVIQETRPSWVIGENVANFINMAFTRTKVDLESIGYTVQPFIIPACGVGANHNRNRVWIIAHIDSEGVEGLRSSIRNEATHSILCGLGAQELTSDFNSDGFKQNSSLQARDEGESFSNFGTSKEESSSNINSNGLDGEANATEEKNYKRIWQSNGWSEAATDFGCWWANQSGMGRAIYGFSNRVDRHRKNRIKSLGNAVTPLIPEIIGRAVLETERRNK